MSELKKENIHISGMHCRSCEILVEDHISEVTGVKKVNVDYKKGVAEVYYENKPQNVEIEKAIRNAGYGLGVNKKRPLLSSNPVVYIELIFAIGILAIVIMWLKILGITNLNFQFSSTPSFLVVGLIGLAAGVSTCMALLGGLVLGISSRHAELHPEATISQKFKPHLFFNLGRLASYAILGGAIGSLGSVFNFSSSTLGFLIIFAGIIMFVLGLKMTEVFPRLSGSLMLPKGISRLFGLHTEVKEYSHKNALITGVLTFFLPCGFTQAMQIYAISTGSFTQGAIIMFLFALGTMPGLLGIGGLTSLVKGWFARYFFKFVALVMLILAVMNISNGYNLTGVTFAGSNGNNTKQEQLSGKIINGEQVVEITQLPSGYSPKKITVKKDVPVKLLVNATNLYVCTAAFVIPKFQIFTQFKEGINEVKFTPTETGPIKFSCAMGMYTGVINVIN
ncbi:MAG: sulfite exporter TauE/SafE family protein [Candidatus Taylorbacteria bacterium]|nr:sulfite exporter TauE/SafE family protein [Candidatus Taylorbacteria bacterium]